MTQIKLLHIYHPALFNTGNICRQMECGGGGGEQYLSQLSVWQIVSTGYNYYRGGMCGGGRRERMPRRSPLS